MIIVEGPDGAGKTTLIRQMQAVFGLGVAPRVVAQDTTEMTDLKAWVEQNLEKGFQYEIFDRYRLISEFCYGPTLRPVARPGFIDRTWVTYQLYRLYAEVRPIIIYCLPKLEVIKKNLENDPDNDVVRDHIEQIYSAYLERSALDQLILPHQVEVWDYTLDDIVERRAHRDLTGKDLTDTHILSPLQRLIDYAKDRVR